MKKPSAYIETTIISYLAAKKSRDIIVRAHQQITNEWWEKQRSNFDIFISEIVLREILRGDKDAVARRKSFVSGIAVLDMKEEIIALASDLVSYLNIPQKSQLDALHLSFAIEYRMDYLLTWNCTHLANGFIINKLKEYELSTSKSVPVIVTPEELTLGGVNYDMG